MKTFLIVDDDDAVRDGLAEALKADRYRVEEAASGREALGVLARHKVNGIFLDLRMPGIDGIEALRQIKALPSSPPVVVLTAFATPENTIEAMRLGAFDHLTKPISRADVLSLASRMAQIGPSLPETPSQYFAGMIGASGAMRELQKQIGRVADGTSTVLITGETGTGKEVVAQAIHRFGDRASKPFIAINCAAVPAELMESELFGHVRGAFTGALADRQGAFAEANGGLLFLDEIGDMPLAMQAKMLRILQERTVTPIGGKVRPVDVRIIAATHRDLGQRAADGLFREDLLYRLDVLPIHISPLRERKEDIVPLAEYFLHGHGRKKTLSADATATLTSYDWPGNVRQLRNAIERASVLSQADVIGVQDLAFLHAETRRSGKPADGHSAGGMSSAVEKLELTLIQRALATSKGNRAEAARLLDIPRQQLYVKLKKYGL